jgi:hypothetical protein
MISEKEKYELFENYLKGALDYETKVALEDSLRKDPELSRELEEYRQAHRLIFERGLLDLREEIASLHQAKLKTGRNWRYGRNILISAGILVTGVLLYKGLNLTQETDRVKDSQNKSVAGIENVVETVEKENEQNLLTDRNEDHGEMKKTTTDSTILKLDDQSLKSTVAAGDNVIDKPLEAIANPLRTSRLEPEATPLDISKPDGAFKPEEKLSVDEKTDQVNAIPCENVLISFEFVAENTCKDRAQGRILFLSQSLRGGKPPYEYSINGGSVFEARPLFDNLQGGPYRLAIRDANHCQSAISFAEVNEFECDIRIAPNKGEVWEIPIISGKEGKLFIFSKEGNMKYYANVGASYNPEWDGRTLNGEPLPLGVYLFSIEFNDGSQVNGTITIIK